MKAKPHTTTDCLLLCGVVMLNAMTVVVKVARKFCQICFLAPEVKSADAIANFLYFEH